MSAITHLQFLESEAIYILRETAAQFQKPALLFSGGKDSIVMAWLARKAFYPSKLPFPLLHVDTGHNFPEAMEYRDWFVQEIGANLTVGLVQKSIDDGRVQEEKGHNASRNKLQTVTLLDTIEEHQYDACLGGGRRDEEKARAKERFFSHRDEFGQWDPKNQRPELWNIFNGRKHFGEHFRVFPLSNWTEMDIWQYIAREQLEVPCIYYAHRRDVVWRGGWLPVSHLVQPKEGEEIKNLMVRFRTVGDMSCTCPVESNATTPDEIILETAGSRITERGATRMDDKTSEASMELRKREGYF
ncbi:MAG: sulfate adenylyltransferase subunit CysD [Gammaproteobacteria bacterium]|nr:sulfate adenylyltransferase subunit CysD [Gammaproteobacteria bacterium]